MNAPTVLRDLALFLSSVLGIYNILIWIRILFSWIQIPGQMRGTQQEGPIITFIGKIVDPFLNMFKGVRGLSTKTIDFSPLLAFALLSIVKSLLQIYGQTGSLTLAVTVALILQTLYSYMISPFFVIFIILLVVRLYFCYRRTPTTIAMARGLETIIGGLLNFVQKTFFGSKGVANKTLVIASLIFTVVLYVLVRIGFVYLIHYIAYL
ncbi:MAG: YggT family protein [Sphaerochaetaceae bacterium]